MGKASQKIVVDGVTFELRPALRNATDPGWIAIKKPIEFVNRYRALATKFQHCNMVEVGIYQGGSTAFFTKLFNPKRLLGVDISEDRVKMLDDFLAEHDKEQRVKIHWGVDQADAVKIPLLVDDMFGTEPLDIVVDDASHLLKPTTATFELLFPRLRQGGVYVIEDWHGAHRIEADIVKEVTKTPDGAAARAIDALVDHQHDAPMSQLICQLVIAAARYPERFLSISIHKGIVEIRRGKADIEPGTPISDYLGELGNWMFEP
jgi:predicted O-methyltransferase YrrM